MVGRATDGPGPGAGAVSGGCVPSGAVAVEPEVEPGSVAATAVVAVVVVEASVELVEPAAVVAVRTTAVVLVVTPEASTWSSWPRRATRTTAPSSTATQAV